MENVHSYWHILLCDKSYCPFHSKAVSKNCWQRFCRWAVLSHSLSPRTDQAPRKPATRFVFFLKHRRFLKLFRLKKSNHFIMQWADLTYSGTNRDFNDNQDTVRSIPEQRGQIRLGAHSGRCPSPTPCPRQRARAPRTHVQEMLPTPNECLTDSWTNVTDPRRLSMKPQLVCSWNSFDLNHWDLFGQVTAKGLLYLIICKSSNFKIKNL